MTHQKEAVDLLQEFLAWLADQRSQPPEDFPVLILVTDPSGQRVRQWRLQKMAEAMGLVAALKHTPSEEK